MNYAILLVAMLSICTGALGQTRKCVGPDGKVTYSDVLCAGQSPQGKEIDTSANTIDHSGMRGEVAKQKAQAANEVRQQKADEAAAKKQANANPCDAMKFERPMPTEREAAAHQACMRRWAKDYRRQ